MPPDTTVEQDGAAITALNDAFDRFIEAPLSGLDREELLSRVRAFEQLKRRLSVADHAHTIELESRGVAQELGAPDTAGLLRQMLRLSPGEAGARASAARLLGSSRAVTGQLLEPVFAAVAAAQAEGDISTGHAYVITSTVSNLPVAARAEYGALVETTLTNEALRRHPNALATVARQFVDRLDPDGILADEADHDRCRDLTLRHHRDGSGTLSGRLTPALSEKLQTAIDALAAPSPADVNGGKDTRTPGQRRHDAVESVLDRVLRSGALPDCGGLPATVLITMTVAQAHARRGIAISGHGGLFSIRGALELADQARVVTVTHDEHRRIVGIESTLRTATKSQRFALAARDGGCSFPDCDVPPAWSEAHHVIEWSQGGATNLDNLTLLCGYHHRHHDRAGWQCRMHDGVPEWIPPAFIDPSRRPRRNTAHALPSTG